MKIKKIRNVIKYYLMMFFYCTRNKKSEIVYFNSFAGRQYSDNPRAISEYIHKLAPDVQLIWKAQANVKDTFPPYVKTVISGTIDDIRAQAQASVWVLNEVFPRYSCYKGGNQLYIQTWHGDRGFKSVGRSAAKAMGKLYQKHDSLADLSKCDFYVTGSKFGENVARDAFNYKGDFIKAGSPRNDKLFIIDTIPQEIESIKNKISIPLDSRILLYAPTFRDTDRLHQKSEIDIQKCIASLQSDGSKWIALVRSHATSRFDKQSLILGTNIVDVSSYPDMADLLLVTDCLITDYSSSACDFILAEKPCIIINFNGNRFEEEYRALAVNPKEAGFITANNENELYTILKNIEAYNHSNVASIINKYYGTYENGTATQCVGRVILEYLNK